MRFTIIKNKQGCHPPHISYDFLPPGGTIGRSGDNNLILPDEQRTISRLQAIVHVTANGECRLTNRGNITPIKLNDTVLENGQQITLRDGDLLNIDGYVLRVASMQSHTVSPVAESDLPPAESAGNIMSNIAPPEIANAIPNEIWDSLLEEFSVDEEPAMLSASMREPNPLHEMRPELNPADPLSQVGPYIDLGQLSSREHPIDTLFDNETTFARETILADVTPTTLLGSRSHTATLRAQTATPDVTLDIPMPSDKSFQTSKNVAAAADLDPLSLFSSPSNNNGNNLDPLGLFHHDPTPVAESIFEPFAQSKPLTDITREPSLSLEDVALTALEEKAEGLSDNEEPVKTVATEEIFPAFDNVVNPAHSTYPKEPLITSEAEDTDSSDKNADPVNTAASDNAVAASGTVAVSGTTETLTILGKDVKQSLIVPDTEQAAAEKPQEQLEQEIKEPLTQTPQNTIPVQEEIESAVAASVFLPPAKPSIPSFTKGRKADKRMSIDPISYHSEQARTPQAEGETLQGDLLEALLQGMDLNDISPKPVFDQQQMQLAGRLLSVFSQGTVALLSSRSILKRGVKADMTVVLDEANNPFKLLPSGKSTLMQIFSTRLPGFMPAEQAVRDALIDLQAHQLGMIAGIRAIIAAMLQAFNPERLEHEAKNEGSTPRFSLTANKKAALWDYFVKNYHHVSGEVEDDFHTLFGEAFLHAYEVEVNQYKDSQFKPDDA